MWQPIHTYGNVVHIYTYGKIVIVPHFSEFIGIVLRMVKYHYGTLSERYIVWYVLRYYQVCIFCLCVARRAARCRPQYLFHPWMGHIIGNVYVFRSEGIGNLVYHLFPFMQRGVHYVSVHLGVYYFGIKPKYVRTVDVVCCMGSQQIFQIVHNQNNKTNTVVIAKILLIIYFLPMNDVFCFHFFGFPTNVRLLVCKKMNGIYLILFFECLIGIRM